MIRRWLLLLGLAAVAVTVLAAVGAPAPALLGAMVGGLVVSLTSRAPEIPRQAGTVGQAVIGVSVGTLVSADLLDTLARHGGVIALALLATLLVSLAWGQILRLRPGVSATTATFASIAGGASGVVATARDVGADEPVVATIQYLRVLAVLFTLPVVAPLIGASAGTSAPVGAGAGGGTGSGYLLAGLALVVGLLVVRRTPFPGGAVVVPMLLGAGLSATGLIGPASVPTLALDAAYVLIGAQVGVKFTPETLRTIVALLPLAVVQVVGTIGSCALIGYVVAETTGIGHLDAYLATTPGGLYAVVAVALSTGGDTGLVFSLQILRLFAALLMVPLLARLTRAEPDENPEAA